MSMLARAYLHLRIERGRESFLSFSLSLPLRLTHSLPLSLSYTYPTVHSFVRKHIHAYSMRGIINRGPMSGFHSLSLPLARQLGGHLRNATVFADVLRPKYRAFGTNTVDYYNIFHRRGSTKLGKRRAEEKILTRDGESKISVHSKSCRIEAII